MVALAVGIDASFFSKALRESDCKRRSPTNRRDDPLGDDYFHQVREAAIPEAMRTIWGYAIVSSMSLIS